MIEKYIDSAIQGDCVEILKDFPEKSVDLIFADPPYKLEMPKENAVAKMMELKKFKRLDEKWDKFSELDEYVNFTQEWIRACKRVLKDTGNLWISGTYHNIGIINYVLQKQKIMIINEIIWYKRNAFPNLACRRFTASHETLIWCADKKKKYYFNYEFTKNHDFKNDGLKKEKKQMRSVWDIVSKKDGNFKHPAQKPEELLFRIISACSKPEDIVLDPFGGSGATANMAKKLCRKWITIESDPKYVEMIERRLGEKLLV